jgi:SAM-dependent methyltransferase
MTGTTKENPMQPAIREQEEIRTTVRARYGEIAASSGTCCSGPSCAGTPTHDAGELSRRNGYTEEELAAVPEGSNLGLGCGNPQAIASLQPGETVLDLGSGAGFDAFLAARAVGVRGHVIGVDMTPEMLTKARANAAKAGYENVEFRLGEIEHLPVADSTVDVIISNCVINLSPDKPAVFREAFRVLKSGGRLAVSDVVAMAPIPAELQKDWELYTGCVAGASTVEVLRALLEEVGFAEVRITRKGESRDILENWFPGRGVADYVASASIQAVKP